MGRKRTGTIVGTSDEFKALVTLCEAYPESVEPMDVFEKYAFQKLEKRGLCNRAQNPNRWVTTWDAHQAALMLDLIHRPS